MRATRGTKCERTIRVQTVQDRAATGSKTFTLSCFSCSYFSFARKFVIATLLPFNVNGTDFFLKLCYFIIFCLEWHRGQLIVENKRGMQESNCM